jgi:hypothetical protein
MQASTTALDLNLKHGLAGHGDCFWGQCSRSKCSTSTISLKCSARQLRVTGDKAVQLQQSYAPRKTKSFRQQSGGTSVKSILSQQNWIRLHNKIHDRLKSQRMGTETSDWGQRSVARPVRNEVKCRAAAVSFNVRTPTRFGEASFKKRSPGEHGSDCKAPLRVLSNLLTFHFFFLPQVFAMMMQQHIVLLLHS